MAAPDPPTRTVDPVRADATHTAVPGDPDLTVSRPSFDPNRTLDFPAADGSGFGFELEEELGRGAMGVVFRGRQKGLNRPVAIKLALGGERAGSKELIRFLAEAEAVASVRHKNVVEVYEFGQRDGRPFLAMEFCSGGTLADWLKSASATRLDASEAADLIARIADGVAAAHDLGIVHRDLKPSNVMFDAAGEPKVTDFGLAKRAAGADLTATQAVMGTPAYMSPEQARGEAKFVGPPADVWALGVILFECLTGTRPFLGDDHWVILQKVQDDEPASVRSLVPEVPRDLALICRKCLAKEPRDRYPSAAELAADLRRFTAGESVSVRAPGVVERTYRWAKRKPTLAGLYAAAVFGLVLVAVSAGFAVLARDADRARGEAEKSRDDADRARGEAEKSRDDAIGQRRAADAARQEADRQRSEADWAREREKALREEVEKQRERLARIEYGRTIQVAHQAWRDSDIAGAQALLSRTEPALRGWEWQYVYRLCSGQLFRLDHPHRGGVQSAAFRPDGHRFVTAGNDAEIKLWDSNAPIEHQSLSGHRHWVFAAVFSPDGTRLASASADTTARIWDAASGRELAELRGHTDFVYSAAWSADGTRLVTASADRTVRIWDANDGKPLRKLDGFTIPVRTAAFAPDGTRLLICGHKHSAGVWDARTGTELLSCQGHADWVYSAVFSPDGSQLLTASADGTARLWNAATGAEVRVLRGPFDYVAAGAFSPDGSRIATIGSDKSIRLWDAKTGAELGVLSGHSDALRTVSYHPDGARLITASDDGTVRIWDANPPHQTLPFRLPEACWPEDDTALYDRTARWDRAYQWDDRELRRPQGAGLAIPFQDRRDLARGTVWQWDTRTGNNPIAFRGHTDRVWSVASSSDGTRVVTAGDDKSARVWDAASGRELLILEGHTQSVNSAAFSPDGTRIATGSDDRTVRIWDAQNGRELLGLRGLTSRVLRVQFSPNGTRLAAVSNDLQVMIWDAPFAGEPLVLWGHQADVNAIAFSPDGTHVALAINDGTLRICDAKTGAMLAVCRGNSAPVFAVAFSPNGSRLVTGSGDNTVRLWDAKAGAEVLTLKGHKGAVVSAAFSADGSHIASVGYEDGVRFWDAAPPERAFNPLPLAPPPRLVK